MANTNAPNGFSPIGRLDGAAWTGKTTERKIAAAYGTKIYRGDPVEVLNTGYIARGAAGETGHLTAGIFMGCNYFSTSYGSWRWSWRWPAADTAIDAIACIIDDPNVLFEVQSSGTAITLADIGQNADYALGTGNDTSGQSGASLDQGTLGVTTTLPFRITGLLPGVGNGSDHTASYNRVIVCWNDQFYRQMAGI
jgi:hypothetical protein